MTLLYCTVLQEYLKKVVYKYQDEIVQFDGNGDPPGRYDIVNFQEIQTAHLFCIHCSCICKGYFVCLKVWVISFLIWNVQNIIFKVIEHENQSLLFYLFKAFN